MIEMMSMWNVFKNGCFDWYWLSKTMPTFNVNASYLRKAVFIKFPENKLLISMCTSGLVEINVNTYFFNLFHLYTHNLFNYNTQ